MSVFDAIEHGDLQAVRKEIRSGADLEAIDESTGVTPLALAAECGHGHIVRVLLRAGVDPDWGGATTPLEAAALEGHREVMRTLIQARADVNRPVADGFTPLITAASNGDLESVRLLLDAGALPEAIDDEGDNALALARKKGHDEIVAEIEARLEQNGHRSSQRSLFAALENRDLPHVQEWISRGPDLAATNGRGLTPLARAAELGHLGLVRPLLKIGADVDHGGTRTPLFCAAAHRHEPVVRELLGAGAQVDGANPADGKTPLMAAAANGHLDILNALLAAGADPKRVDKAGLHALAIAAAHGQTQAFAILQDRYMPIERGDAERELASHVDSRKKIATRAAELIDLIRDGEIDKAKRLLASGLVDPDGFDENGRTALMMAAHGGHRDVLRMLINAGASFEVGDDNGPGWTALIHAIRSQTEEPHLVVSLLAAAGADPNRASGDGMTPLMHAVEAFIEGPNDDARSFVQLIEPLLHTGADLHATDADGLSAVQRVEALALRGDTAPEARARFLHVLRELEKIGARTTDRTQIELVAACAEGRSEDVRLLLQRAGDPRSLESLPLLGLAASAGHWEVVNRLLEIGISFDTPDHGGRTLLMHAAAAGLQPVVEQLVAVGANLALKDNDGHAAWQIAEEAGHDDVAEWLKKKSRGRKKAVAAA